jgi:formylglycine-generating enzyme required for sulfatase activity
MSRIDHIYFLSILIALSASCRNNTQNGEVQKIRSQSNGSEITTSLPDSIKIPEGMVWIPGGEFYQGAVTSDTMAMDHERPQHKVAVDGFLMDTHEVTNAQFAKFVDETGYVTVAERAIDWEDMKQQVPPGTPKPHDSILQPGSLVFKKTQSSVPNLFDYSQWWVWKIGANWRHPQGPGSTIYGKGDHPVVHIAYEDALAYCKWSGRRLPTEAEWEYAARGGIDSAVFTWGMERDSLSQMANTWEGEFPVYNSKHDGYERTAPVMSYPPNNFGLFDMAGNVWEWTNDWYNTGYYSKAKDEGTVRNPKGASNPYNPRNPLSREKVLKGGSFLCSDSYCASYRPSARMGTSLDCGMEHLGFRTVMGREEHKNKLR